MKKAIVLLFSVMLMFVFTACGGGDGGSESKSDDKSDPNVIQIGDYTAEYKGYEIVKDYDGDDAIIVTWNYTNNGEEAESFTWAFNYTLFQDGIELEYGTVFIEDSYDTVDENMNTEIKPGNSLEVKTTNKLENLESPVEVEFSDLMGDDTASMEIDITK